MKNKVYFIADNGEQNGPFSLNELEEMEITKSTLVWKEGFANWVEAVEVDDLKSVLKITPPKLPNSKKDLDEENKTLNVNLSLGKPETKNDYREKLLAKEKVYVAIAKGIKFLLGRAVISAILMATYFLFLYAYYCYVNNFEFDPSGWQVGENEELNRLSSGLIICACYIVFLQKPAYLIYKWIKTYSNKEI